MSDPKLLELTASGNFRARVEKTLDSLKSHGEDPKIFEGMRTPAQQREKVLRGVSKTMRSYHLKRGPDKLGLAADIADRKKGWNASKRFWLILGANCQTRALGWGGLFGLSAKHKKGLLVAMARLRDAGWPEDHDAYEVPIGWDPAHVQLDSNW